MPGTRPVLCSGNVLSLLGLLAQHADVSPAVETISFSIRCMLGDM